MRRRDFIKKTTAAGALALASQATSKGEKTSSTPAKSKRPNILYVFPDQWRPQALGFMGEDPVSTPHLDRFAAESRVLTHCVSTHPLCSPYRAMLLTGKLPHRTGVYTNVNSKTVPFGNYLQNEERCFSDILSEEGYSAGYIGKWHLDPPREEEYPYLGEVGRPVRGDGRVWDAYTPPGPRRRGFDFWYSYGAFDAHFRPHYWTGEDPVDQRKEVYQWSPAHETDVAIEYLKNEDGKFRDPAKPFALVMSMNPPHPPYDQVVPTYREEFDRMPKEELLNRPNVDLESEDPGAVKARAKAAGYFAMVNAVDEQFGRIMATLEEEGLADDTIVVFTSDHGELMGSHNHMQKNLWYKESANVPFIVRWPGKIEPGRDDLLLGTTDVFPTLLSLAGLESSLPEDLDGVDRSAVFLGKRAERPEYTLYTYSRSPDSSRIRRGLIGHKYSFVCDADSKSEIRWILHDNVSDPYQMKNIAPESPELVAELKAKLVAMLERYDDPWVEQVRAAALT